MARSGLQQGDNRASHGEKLRRLPIPNPPVSEQRTIADFLDRETARIDTVIERNSRLLALIAERRRIFITAAVTGQMLPPGQAWHASDSRVRPLRAYVDVQLGRQRSPQHEQGPHMVQYLRAANVKDGVLDLADVKSMNFTPQEQRIFSLTPDDVLVSEGAGSLSAVGTAAVWNEELPGVVCFQNTLLRLRPHDDRVSPQFLMWWARHAYGSGLLAAEASGVNIYHLSADRVRSIPVQFPPLRIQQAIAEFLDEEARLMEVLKARIEAQIQLLQEHRHALITAAVTGQLDASETA
jgi:restriction endonuclease S subunit